jgi:hypothetical protein
VTQGYFGLLGATPVVGRVFLPEEESRGGEPVVVLAYGLWQRAFGGRPDVVGATATIGDRSHRIVGVAPPDFRGLGFERVDAWLLMTVAPDLCSFTGRDLLDDTTAGWLTTVGRLRPGVSAAAAEGDIRRLSPMTSVAPAAGCRSARWNPRCQRPAVTSCSPSVSRGRSPDAGDRLRQRCRAAVGPRRPTPVRLRAGATWRQPRPVFAQLFAENLMLAGASVIAAWGVATLVTAALSAFFPPLARRVVGSAEPPRAGRVHARRRRGRRHRPGHSDPRAYAAGLWRIGRDVGYRPARWRSALIEPGGPRPRAGHERRTVHA